MTHGGEVVGIRKPDFPGVEREALDLVVGISGAPGEEFGSLAEYTETESGEVLGVAGVRFDHEVPAILSEQHPEAGFRSSIGVLKIEF